MMMEPLVYIFAAKRMKIDVCLPVKNEEEILAANVVKILLTFKRLLIDYQWRLIIAVNGSTDKSLTIATHLVLAYPEVLSCREVTTAGKGGAIKNVWQQSAADILVFLDADLAIEPEIINFLLTPILSEEADLVIGSRFLPAASFERSWRRTAVSRGYIFLSKLLLRHNFSDLQCGFKAIKKTAFQKLAGRLREDGWFFDTELVILASRLGLVVKEIPVAWRESRSGQRKSGVRIFRDSQSFLANLWRFYWLLRKS